MVMRYIFLLTALFAVTFSQAQTVYPQTEALAQVRVPALPRTMTFAGERVPLENFDTRESLTRELLITCNMHSRTMLTILNSARYTSIIKPILQEMGVPEDFVYLCMAESGFDPNAVSSAKAAGLWQLMPETARAAGLEVGPEVDERYDIQRSTYAALKYLLKSKERFCSWTLAAAAYNMGDNGLSKRLALQVPCANYYDIWMPDEPRRYVFRILAWKLISENPAMYGFSTDTSDMYGQLTDYHEVTVSGKDIKWPEFAAANGTTYKLLRELNHWIRDYAYANPNDRTLTVKIPNKHFRHVPVQGK
jgi:hypothetical protein